MNTISFVKLGLNFSIDRVAFTLGPVTVYWYALIIVTGIILGFLYALHFTKKENLNPDYLYDVLLYGLPCAILGARLYYVAFNFSDYRENLTDVFKIWEGGIAIYGAVIGAVISTYIYARKKQLPVLLLFDLGAFGLLVGQAVGRWGNFVNQEAFGTNTDSLFQMSGNLIHKKLIEMQASGMAVDPAMGVHPTFLYESAWNLLGAILLGVLHKRKKHHGQMFFCYLLWYGMGRFFIEGLRTDSLYFYGIRVSQGLALLSALFAILGLLLLAKKKPLPKTDDCIDIPQEFAGQESSLETKEIPTIDKEIKRNTDSL